MRSISVNLYKYDELPTEIAKDVATVNGGGT